MPCFVPKQDATVSGIEKKGGEKVSNTWNLGHRAAIASAPAGHTPGGKLPALDNCTAAVNYRWQHSSFGIAQ